MQYKSDDIVNVTDVTNMHCNKSDDIVNVSTNPSDGNDEKEARVVIRKEEGLMHKCSTKYVYMDCFHKISHLFLTKLAERLSCKPLL